MQRVGKFLSANRFLIGILLLSVFLRLYNFQELFYYSHDNDLAGWFIKDVVVNHHLRLIGQETSTRGIFIGPLFYYLQIPFYLLTNMDPIGATLLSALLGTFATWSIYFVFSKMWNRNIGIIGAFIHAVSFYTVFVEREVVPTMPVFLWTTWLLYGLWLLLKGKQTYAWPILGVLLGLIWHINFALVLLVPLVPLALWLGRGKVDWKAIIIGVALCAFLSLPLITFEARHNFQQSHALLNALTTDQQDVVEGASKWERTFHLASKNVAGLLLGNVFEIQYELVHVVILSGFGLLLWRKKIEWQLGSLMVVWLLCYIVFFSLYSKILSEYYLNGMIVVYIAILATGIWYLLQDKTRIRVPGVIAIVLFAAINLYRFFTIPVNKSGYVYRKEIVSEIKADAQKHGYPCISISYIVDPGNDLGYRYFFWRADMHVNRPDSGSPVYTILFPLKPIFKEDKAFGALGLIYPDYNRYTKEVVDHSCSGENSNLTDPMFGYTE